MARKKTTTDLATCDPDRLRNLADTGNTEALELLQKQFQDKPELARRFSTLAGAAQEGRTRRMLDRAHNRYLSAITALAKIRKLSLPTVQVNIADKQINTTGGIVTPKDGEG